jgi:fructokinase
MFVVCGEALMDVFSAGEASGGLSLDARVGGSPFNVAVGLARMGQPVGLLAALSHDFMGERLLRSLQSEGVATSMVQRTHHSTTLSVVGLDGNQVPSYAFYGANAADRQLRLGALSTLPSNLRALHFGSYATVVEPIAATLRALVEREHRRTVISLDPNVRLNVEPEVAVWQSYLEWMLPRTHLLKVSDEDLQLLMPGVAPETFAARALQSGVRLVVLTRGAEGASAWTSQGEAHVERVSVEVVDTVGAGDTFQAALLTWLQESNTLAVEGMGNLGREDLEQAMNFCARAAAITCTRRGADLPRRHELNG